MRARPLLTVLVAWTIGTAGIALRRTWREPFLAKDTFSAGDFGYGLMFGSIGLGLALGSIGVAVSLERRSVGSVYGGAIAVAGIGYGLAAVSPNVWVASACCVVAGIGNGGADRVQRAARPARRPRRAARPRLHGDHEHQLRSASGSASWSPGHDAMRSAPRWVCGGRRSPLARSRPPIAWALTHGADAEETVRVPAGAGGRMSRGDWTRETLARRRPLRRPARARPRDHARREPRPAGGRARSRALPGDGARVRDRRSPARPASASRA